MMKQIYKELLPDDRPLTAIIIIEDPEKCPPGFSVISRTHDQDSDADLWRQASFFGSRVTRYICISKTEGLADYVVDNVMIVAERESHPVGYTVLNRTSDSEQKALRKKLFFYRQSKRSLAATVVTDIVLLGRSKKPPEGFSIAGDINGVVLCFKSCPISIANQSAISPSHSLPYSLNDKLPSPLTNGSAYPSLPDSSPSHDYERLRPEPLLPKRPAPKPPVNNSAEQPSYCTIATYSGLEGVPFVVNSELLSLTSNVMIKIPTIRMKTKYQLDQEYNYDFSLERQT